MRILNRSLNRRGIRVAVGQNQDRVLLWLVNPGQAARITILCGGYDTDTSSGVLPLSVTERSMIRCHYGPFTSYSMSADTGSEVSARCH
jgi:hypothetical protein